MIKKTIFPLDQWKNAISMCAVLERELHSRKKTSLAAYFFRKCGSRSRTAHIEIAFFQRSNGKVAFLSVRAGPKTRRGEPGGGEGEGLSFLVSKRLRAQWPRRICWFMLDANVGGRIAFPVWGAVEAHHVGHQSAAWERFPRRPLRRRTSVTKLARNGEEKFNVAPCSTNGAERPSAWMGPAGGSYRNRRFENACRVVISVACSVPACIWQRRCTRGVVHGFGICPFTGCRWAGAMTCSRFDRCGCGRVGLRVLVWLQLLQGFLRPKALVAHIMCLLPAEERAVLLFLLV